MSELRQKGEAYVTKAEQMCSIYKDPLALASTRGDALNLHYITLERFMMVFFNNYCAYMKVSSLEHLIICKLTDIGYAQYALETMLRYAHDEVT